MPDATPSARSPRTERSRSRRLARRAAIGLLACTVLLGLGGWAAAEYLQHRLDAQVDRLDGVFEGLPDRPDRPTEGPGSEALNILVMGSDARPTAPDRPPVRSASWTPGQQRSDTMMLVHVAADGAGASVVSLPRDAWVDVPGHGPAKLNAAFSWGGPSLAVAAVERLSDVRIDHVAWIDWTGFERLTDALGGVRVWVPHTVHDSARDVTWTRGMHDLDGAEALTYVRQRYGLRDGDLDRVKRQQYYLRSLMDGVRHSFRPTDPGTSYDILDAVTENLTVDAELDGDGLRDLLFTLLDLRSDEVDFLTVPVSGYGTEGAQSVVRLDAAAGAGLWDAVREDRVRDWALGHPATRTPEVVR